MYFKNNITKSLLIILSITLLSAGCGDSLVDPRRNEPLPEPKEPSVGSSDFGLVKVTISGIGTEHMSSKMVSVPPKVAFNLTSPEGGDGTIQVKSISNGSFTVGERGNGGMRYVFAKFKVRNAQTNGTPYTTKRQNLTFLAVDTDETADFETIGLTPIYTLRLFDGTELTGEAAKNIAQTIVPTGQVHIGVTSGIVSTAPDVLQVFTEGEVAGLSSSGVNVFPYGFVTRTPGVTAGSRTLSANPGTEVYDGIVTFAFKLPLQAAANDDPFEITMLFLPVDDSKTRITQSIEEQTPTGLIAFKQRSAALNLVDGVTLLPGTAYSGGLTARLICEVRTSGAVGVPDATYMIQGADFSSLIPNPYSKSGHYIADNATLTTTFTALVCGNDSGAVNDATFVVHGFQSGKQFVGQIYPDVSGTSVTTPSVSFFPGELVGVTLTTGLGITEPVVANYRVAVVGGSGSFIEAAGSPVTVGSDPFFLAAGDVNRDGSLDLFVANQASNNIMALLGNGTGGFIEGSRITVGTFPEALVMGDFDGNGQPDIAVANALSNNILLLGTCFCTIPVGTGPRSLAAGDWNADGNLDLVVGNRQRNNISVLLGDGTGSFSEAVSSPISVGAGPQSIAAGDWDSDGELDLAVANRGSDNISVLLGDGMGSFVEAEDSPVSVRTGPFSLASGDWNADGNLDLAVSNSGSDNISVLLGDGSGDFSETANSPVSVGTFPESLVSGDWDGDGDIDLAVANFGSSSVTVLLNDGSGNYSVDSSISVGSGSRALAAGDWDGDGDLDLAVANENDNTVSILLNQNL